MIEEDTKQEQLYKKLKELIREYLRRPVYFSDGSNPGQLECYNSAVMLFWIEQKNLFREFFNEQNWDVTNQCASADLDYIIAKKHSVCIIFSRKLQNDGSTQYYLKIKKDIGDNEKEEKVYRFKVKSDFAKNPHYELETDDVGSLFRRIKAESSNIDELEDWVNDLDKVVKHNRQIGKNYNFRLSASLWDGSKYNLIDAEYANLVEFIKAEMDGDLL